MKHTDLITQIVLMHCPVEEIRKDAKKEKDLIWKKITAIAEDYTTASTLERQAKGPTTSAGTRRASGAARTGSRTSRTATAAPAYQPSYKANASGAP